jgi:hypothetical protein
VPFKYHNIVIAVFFPYVSVRDRNLINFGSKQSLIDRFIVLNATFDNISIILWRSVLLVEETGVPGENHQPVASH